MSDIWKRELNSGHLTSEILATFSRLSPELLHMSSVEPGLGVYKKRNNLHVEYVE